MRGAMVDYSLNKFCPLLIIGFLLFYNFGYLKFEPYIILGLICFIEKFNFNVGYSVAYCECHGINLRGE